MTTEKKSLPKSNIDGDEARDNARAFAKNPNSPSRLRLCLKFVRDDCWRIPSRAYTAHEAWDEAVNKTLFKGDLDKFADSIPVGAPVFSRRKGAAANDAWHVFIACGWWKHDGKRIRIFRSTDIRAYGEVDACTIHAFVNKWNHEILGYTHDLNGVSLDLN